MRTSPTAPRIIRLSVSIYRTLIRGFGPTTYFWQYGDSTVQLFRECCQDAYSKRGIPGVLGLWFPSFRDAVIQMAMEVLCERQHTSQPRVSVGTVASALALEYFSAPIGNIRHFIHRLTRPLLRKRMEPRKKVEQEKDELRSGSFDESQLLSSMVSSDEMLDRSLLREVLTLALGEARRMHKDYLGTPHLFIALTGLERGRTQDALRSLGRSPEEVSGAIRLALGSGKATSDTQISPTRRCKKILQSAERNAINAHSTSVDERAIAQAVLSEEDGVLRELLTKRGINPSRLIELILAESRKF